MRYIDESKIQQVLLKAQETTPARIKEILEKTNSLQRLTLEETASLLTIEDRSLLQQLFDQAAKVKEQIYGKRVVLFAPLYISNICQNNCAYCAFSAENKQLERKALGTAQITQEVEWLLQHGHKRILLVAGEAPPKGQSLIDYYVEAIKTIYAANVKGHKIKRVNINCAPLSIEEFKQLKAAGIGTFQIFQETYHEATYRKYHTRGPKSDPDKRISAVDNAFAAGIDDIGIGALYGLYDYRFETLALLMHVEAMEAKHGVGPHTISVPRIEPALGSELSAHVPYPLTDEQFKKLVAVLRLAVPYTGIILSTRESATLRDELFKLGISQVSAGSRTSPGGYAELGDNDAQFSLGDGRTLDQVIDSLLKGEFIPSFCAACYRSERTGEKFMDLAKPGTIKGACSMNALITLKEYLDDFASPEVRKKGYAAIALAKQQLPPAEAKRLDEFFADIDRGIRDAFV